MNRVLLGLAALGLGVTAVSPAAAIIRGGLDGNPPQSCVEEVKIANGYSRSPTNCTANDVTFVLVGLGTQDDGCVSATDTVSIALRAIVKNTTSQDRYDIGMYVATDGDVDHSGGLWEAGHNEAGDGARSGVCARQAINVTPYVDSSTPGLIQGVCGPGLPCFSQTCPPMDLAGDDLVPTTQADGPYLSNEVNSSNSTPDWCGGLRDGNHDGCNEVEPFTGGSRWDDSVVDFPKPVVLPCTDAYGGNGGTGSPDGYVEIPTCATWGNQADEVHSATGNDTCDSELELVPGTPAKCRCELINSTIPAPQLALACNGCTILNDLDHDGVLDPGDTARCSVTYTNTRATACDPSSAAQQALPTRERCGTASFVRFKVGYDGANGTVGNLTFIGDTNDLASTVVAGSNSQILWTPVANPPSYVANSPAGSPVQGVLGAGESATLRWDYTLNANAYVPGGAVQFTTRSYWSNTGPSGSWSGEVAQNGVTCSTVVSATPITLAYFEASRAAGSVRFDWTTATEAGNVGFNLYRVDRGGLTKLNPEIIPSAAVDSTQPIDYTFTAAGERGGAYVIEDVNVFGATRRHGPFELGRVEGARPEVEPVDWQELRGEHERTAAKRDRDRGREWTALRAALPETAGNPGDLRGRDPDRQAAKAGDPPAKGSSQAAGASSAAPIRLLVSRDGLYRVTYEQLLTAGFDLAGVKAADLALTDWGEPIAIRVESGAAFGPGAFIEFWGDAADTLYTDTAVYQLAVSKKDARRVGLAGPPPSAASAPAFYMDTVSAGIDRTYSFSSPLDDPWLDTYMLAGRSPGAWNFTIAADNLASGAAPASATAWLWGVTSWPGDAPDHHVIVELNGAKFGERVFDGVAPAVLKGAVSVVEGSNTLTVRLPGDAGFDYDMLAYDALDLTYPRRFVARADRLAFGAAGAAFEVGGFSNRDLVAYRLGAAPVRLTVQAVAAGGAWTARFAGGGEADYAVSTVGALLTPRIEAGRPAPSLPKGKADYLIVAHPDFIDGLADFVADKESQGLDVEVVDVEDVYAAYSYGNFDPMAIRDYIRDAAKKLGIGYVLLVGGDTYDYRGFGSSGSVSFIPSLYAATGDVVNWAPSDALYADVDGDRVVDLALGRWPVRSVAELREVIAKTLQYESKDYAGKAVLAADYYDAAGAVSFLSHSEGFARALGGGGWSLSKAYLDDTPVATARSTVVHALDEGVALASYVGHSGPTRWTFSGLFDTSHAAALANRGKPTVVVQWGCWNTYHVEPAYNTLGHAFLLGQDRGAAAVVGSATLSAAASSEALGERLMPLATRQGQSLGSAIVEAKRQLAADRPNEIGNLLDVLLGWTLLGDPALVIEP